jgi:hypothetical protein
MAAVVGGQWLAAVAASAPSWITALPAYAAAACMRTQETERVRSGPHACVGMGERVECVGPRRGNSLWTDATSETGLVRGEGSTCVRGNTGGR